MWRNRQADSAGRTGRRLLRAAVAVLIVFASLGGFLATPSSAGSTSFASGRSNLLALDATDATPSHYYLWCGVTAPYLGPRDKKGVVMTALGAHRPLAYNPTAIAEWGIHFYENWLHTGKRAERSDFLVQASWLRGAMDSMGRFPYRYAHIDRGIKPPWYSAMAQGIGTSVLLRAYVATGDTSYLAAAKRAVGPFGRDVKRGGVVTAGGAWLEEYPDSYHVLNGSVFAALGLWDMMRVTGRAAPSETTATPTLAESVWTTYTANLAANLGKYESRGAILYEQRADHFCHTKYFDLHLRQLKVLTQLTGDRRFSDTAARWASGFHAYPDPEITVALRPGGKHGHLQMFGTVRYLYSFYYGVRPHAVVSLVAQNAPTIRKAEIVMQYAPSGQTASFAWLPPATSQDATYVVNVAEQPVTPDRRYDYTQTSEATLTIAGH